MHAFAAVEFVYANATRGILGRIFCDPTGALNERFTEWTGNLSIQTHRNLKDFIIERVNLLSVLSSSFADTMGLLRK